MISAALLELVIFDYSSTVFDQFSCSYVLSLLILLTYSFSCGDKLDDDNIDSNFSKNIVSPKINVKLHNLTDCHTLPELKIVDPIVLGRHIRDFSEG